MKIRSLVAFSLMLISFLFLFSCDKNGDKNLNNGILANKEVVSSIRQELEDKENALLANPGDVFWTASGSLWHSTYTCSYLSRSNTIYHGTIEAAKLEGKTKSCDRCGAGNGNLETIYEQIENNQLVAGDVFFVKDKNTWHSTDQCEELLNSDKIYHANRALAIALGKTESCEKCGREK